MTINDIEKAVVEENKKENVDYYSDYDYLNDNCFKRFPMYYSGWECDSTAWIMKDGTIVGTDHGQICIITKEEFEIYKKEMAQVSIDLVDLSTEISKLIKD